ncbi:MAG: sulfatase-like hydrolase/transferase [Clostridium sp.]|nr:sulfatase-like hydrolase/transferase [Clostridium sp.]
MIIFSLNIYNFFKNIPQQTLSEAKLHVETKYNTERIMPDVYIIILDSYPNNEVLKRDFNYDNYEFINYLKNKGFFVYDKMLSNYTKTIGSLPSFTNFEYLENIKYDTSSEALNKSELFYNAKKYGYKTIFINTYIEFSINDNAYIDKVLDFSNIYSSQEYILTSLFFYNTLYENLYRYFDKLFSIDDGEMWKKLPNPDSIANQHNSPKFIFAHILSPHFPYMKNDKGEKVHETDKLINPMDNEYKINKESCLKYILYTNKKTEQTIEEILKASKNKPYIIIMGDHGLRLHYFEHNDDKKTNIIFNEKNTINSYFNTFAAIYTPEKDYTLYKKANSLINFLIIFSNELFKTNYKLKQDKFYYIYFHHNDAKLENIQKNYIELKETLIR